MSKITLNRQNVIIVALLGIIWALPHFDVFSVQCISVAFIVIATFLMTRNLEKSGSLSLISSVGPVFLAETEPYFSETAPVVFATEKVNAALNWLGASARIDGKTCFSLIFYALFAIVLFLLNLRDNTAMGISPEKVDPDRARQTQTLCVTIKNRLDALNRDADWNENNFVPLEAQVEVTIDGKRKRKYTDLLTCLKRNRTFFSFRRLWNWFCHKPGKTVFLVLGDPGAGKSVALRKLCLDLLEEAKTTKKVPVYVNLKKWSREWTVSNPPTKQDLVDFLEKTLRGESRDTFTDSFLDNYFQTMLDGGQWYFVFDSFDEMPCLMGTGNNRELVKIISELLHAFLTDGKQCGGIIASRLYKAPSEELDAEVVLRIQEFDDIRIKKMLHQYLKQASDVVDKLFQEREDMVILCRNPFYLSLLISYIQIWGTRFPKNQMELYAQFLTGRLQKCEGMIAEEGLTESDIRKAAKDLAAFMQNSMEYGLECPAKVIYKRLGSRKTWEKRLRMLEYARLCRIGGQEDTISFVHRRFQEYFLAENFRDGTIIPNYAEYIPSNSGLRDALALYCEVADEEQAKEIARYCWDTVRENIQCKNTLEEPGSLVLINTLYFMANAFRNRRDAIAEFEQEYEAFIEKNLTKDTHFIIQLALANGMALFDQTRENLPRIILRIFEMKNHWLDDVVMRNCRLIKRVDDRIETKFTQYFQKQSVNVFVKRFNNTDFALSKAKGFEYVRLVHSLQFMWYLLFAITALYCVCILFWSSNPTLLITQPELWIKNTVGAIVEIGGRLFQVFLPQVVLPALYLQHGDRVDLTVFQVVLWAYYIDVIFKIAYLSTDENVFIVQLYTRWVVCIIYFEFLRFPAGRIEYLWNYIILFALSSMTILTDSPWILHSCVYSFWRKERLLRALGPVMVILGIWTFVVIILGNTFPLPIKLILYAYFILITLIVFSAFFQNALNSLKDRRIVKRMVIPARIDRAELCANIKRLSTKKWTLTYLHSLLDNNTRLDGDWPDAWMTDGRRKKFDDDDLEHALAMLEYGSVKTENQSYNTVV